MSRNEWEKITDCPYSAKVLILIYQQGEIKKSDVTKYIVGGGQTHNLVLKLLEKEGCIIIEEIKKPHISSRVTLTPKGERAARRYIAIEEDLPEEDVSTGTPPEIRNQAKSND